MSMQAQLRDLLSDLTLGDVRYFESVGSTNDVALDWAAQGAPDFSLVLADEQTNGRGRMGRKWFTPSGAGLALSLIFRPVFAERDHISLFSGLGALALVDALKNYDIAAQVKWPNDILINRKKVAGVLAETVWMGANVEFLVLGIGVNVSFDSVPPESQLAFPATCLQAESPGFIERFDLLHSLMVSLLKLRSYLGTEQFLREWEASLAFAGEAVQIWQGDAQSVVGVVDGLEMDGSLRVVANGEQRIIRFGDIRLRPLQV